jgi:hypothetical protein
MHEPGVSQNTNKGGKAVQIVAALMIAYAAVNLLIGLNAVLDRSAAPPRDDPELALSYELGQRSARPMASPLSLVVHVMVLVGAGMMLARRRGPLPLVSAALLLLPCSTFFCIGAPLGIYALALLLNPRAVGAFDDETPIDTATRPCPHCGRENSVHTKVCPKCNQRVEA